MLHIEGVLADRCFRLRTEIGVHHMSNHLQLHMGLWLLWLLVMLPNFGICDCFGRTSPTVG